ncbi:Carbohydrate esterase 4 protein [Borealophlyctis nickersoniae]|nr:Carbohydrate esterase 4 protein [Borealophlyctis nickersoniae]
MVWIRNRLVRRRLPDGIRTMHLLFALSAINIFFTCCRIFRTRIFRTRIFRTRIFPNCVGPLRNIRVIEQCTVPNTVAITFDDGPYIYTAEIVSAFNAAGGKVTFFMNGNNWDCIYDQATAVKAAFDAGHQIGSHTWSHADLATLNAQQITDEMNKLSAAFKKILGAVPVYMRPPYGSYNSLAQTTLTTLGFKTLAMWDIDSDDSAGASIAAQQKQYTSSSTGVSHNFLNHETYETTARTMVPWIINWAKGRGLKMVTVGECLGDAPANWYKDRVTAETKNPTWVC